MLNSWLNPVFFTLALVIYGCIAMLALTGISRLILRHELRAVRAGTCAPEIAYRNVARKWGRLGKRANIWMYTSPIVLAGILTLVDMNVSGAAVSVRWPIGALICCWGIYDVVPSVFSRLIVTPWCLLPAQRMRQGTAPGAADMTAHWMKWCLLQYGPLFVFTELLGILSLLPGKQYVLLTGVAALAWALARVWLAVPLQRWLNSTIPLEQTPWAPLATRIEQWATRVGVQLKSVQVLSTSKGEVGSAIMGIRQHTLFLSDAFLANTDWRQQDSVVVRQLALARFDYPTWGAVAGVLGLPIGVGIASLVVALWPTAYFNLGDPIEIMAGIVIWVLGLWIAITLHTFVAQVTIRRRSHAAFRYALELTGDPISSVVASNTTNVLARAITLLYKPSPGWHLPAGLDFGAAERRKQLMEPMPLAPWAAQPVPSKIPYVYRDRLVTLPLDDAPPPAPVPTAPYPVDPSPLAQLTQPAPAYPPDIASNAANSAPQQQ